MQERNCTNCRHFLRAESDTAEELSYGECRHSPPSIFVMDDEPVTLFPMVDAESFCGQHKAAQ